MGLLQTPTGRIVVGNALFVVCCAFYLAWWLVWFHPVNPVTGIKTGWLLIPAAAAGMVGVACALWGISSLSAPGVFFPNAFVVAGGVVAYVAFAVLTRWLFERPITSELFLITGWAALAVAQVNALYGSVLFPRGVALALLAVIGVILAISLVCYVWYFRLDAWRSYVDGMVPLVLTAAFMVALNVSVSVYSRR